MMASNPYIAHNMAMWQPTVQEKPMAYMIWCLHVLVQKHGTDVVLREGVVEIARGIKLLLQGQDYGRLDPALLTRQVNGMLAQCGWDPEAEAWTDG